MPNSCFKILVLMLALTASASNAGIDSGNPKFVNMKNSYELVRDGLWYPTTLKNGDVVRVDITQPYSRRYVFFVAVSPPQDASFPLCRKEAIANTSAVLYWFGADCQEAYVKSQFEKLRDHIRYVPFPSDSQN